MRDKSIRELFVLREHASLELLRRGVSLSKTDPAGHLAELLTAATLWADPQRDAAGGGSSPLDVRDWAREIRSGWYVDDRHGPATSRPDHKVDLAIPWTRVREALKSHEHQQEFADFIKCRREARRVEDVADAGPWLGAMALGASDLPADWTAPRYAAERHKNVGQPLTALWELARVQVKARTGAADDDYAIDASKYLPGGGEVGPIDLAVCINIDSKSKHLVKEAWLITAEALETYRVGRLTWRQIRGWQTERIEGTYRIDARMRGIALP